METSEPCEEMSLSESTSSQVDSLARTSVTRAIWQESGAEPGAACGSNILGLLAKYDHDSHSWKTSQVCLTGEFQSYSGTWPRAGMTRNGIAYQRPPLAPPHIRDRVFILAYSRCEPRWVRNRYRVDGYNFMVEQREHREAQEWGINRKLIALVPGVHQGTLADWWRTQSRVDRSTDGVSYRMERLKSGGNAVVPQVAEWIGRRIMEADMNGLAKRGGV